MRAHHGRGQSFHVPLSEKTGRLLSTLQHSVDRSLHSSGLSVTSVILFQPGNAPEHKAFKRHFPFVERCPIEEIT